MLTELIHVIVTFTKGCHSKASWELQHTSIGLDQRNFRAGFEWLASFNLGVFGIPMSSPLGQLSTNFSLF